MRLRLPRVEAKPKPVFKLPLYRDYVGLSRAPNLARELVELVERIEKGHIVPERYYRSGIDTDRDRLLEETGILHLHLGGAASDVLVFLIQYPTYVVLLEVNDHQAFASDPPGSRLLALHEQTIRERERVEAEKEAERRRKLSDDVRLALRRRPDEKGSSPE